MNGARPLGRVIQDEIKRPLTDEMLFGKLASGGSVRVDVADDKVTFDFDAASRAAVVKRAGRPRASSREGRAPRVDATHRPAGRQLARPRRRRTASAGPALS